jgi:hypothetical protein
MRAGYGKSVRISLARARPVNRRRSVTVHLRMARHSTVPGSRRRHGDVRRQFRLTAWYTGDELERVRRAAAADGMAPAAWLAKLGTDAAEAAAGGRAGAAVSGAPDVIAAMSDAMALARRLGYLLDQAVAKRNSVGEHSPGLEASAAVVARAVHRMESATLKAARALR